MSHAILISNNKVISSLYEVNLRAYVATNLTIKKSFSEASQLLSLEPNIDAIIFMASSKKTEPEQEEFLQFLADNKLNIPLVVMGETTKEVPKAINVSNKYDIKALVRAVAKILEITAQKMAELEVPKYFPVPLTLFSQMTATPCDIYFRSEIGDFEYEYFTIIEGGSNIENKLGDYHQDGVEHLYVDAELRLHFINNASAVIVDELHRKDLSAQERVTVTSQSMGIVAEEIFEKREISQNMVNVSRACIESIESTIASVPKFKSLLRMLLEGESEYVYKHSVIATYIAGEIIDNISWGSAEQKSKVSFAFFFHDIFLVPIYKKYPDAINEEDLLFRDDVSDDDKKVVLEHASLAGQIVSKFPRCPMGADMIVTQHHGMANGRGFAINYKDDISPLSKIMIIAEEVTTYILINFQNIKADEKINVDKDKIGAVLDEKFKTHTYKKIITAFTKSDF